MILAWVVVTEFAAVAEIPAMALEVNRECAFPGVQFRFQVGHNIGVIAHGHKPRVTEHLGVDVGVVDDDAILVCGVSRIGNADGHHR